MTDEERTATEPAGCLACAVHHEVAHVCPSCGGDLSMRTGLLPGANPKTEPMANRFARVQSQHEIRVAIANLRKELKKAELDAITERDIDIRNGIPYRKSTRRKRK